jgi:choline dehydrogenase-like flavoprotein
VTATAELQLDAARRRALDAACEALLPALFTEADGELGDFFAHGARERGIDALVADAVPDLALHVRDAVLGLLDDLAAGGFADEPAQERAQELRRRAAEPGSERLAVRQLKTMVFGLLFGQLDETGRNPAWAAVGYPGPLTEPPTPEQAPKTIPLQSLEPGSVVLHADACIVGSGAGGSVIAARLAQAGRSVIVLEAGAYRNESDFRQIDSVGAEMYLGGGIVWAETGQLGLLAGSTLGGGTVINSMVCLRTPPAIRSDWEAFGLEGVGGDEFDAHTDRVWGRIGVNTEATRFNANTERMLAGLDAFGYRHEPLPRNASLDDDPRYCGYCNAGCQHGCKRSTLKTYLEDAAARDARFVVGARVQRILAEDGRARGVQATVQGPRGTTELTVEAPTVIVAAGGIESPALLLRSGIGGPAVGRHLTVHPAWLVTGIYDEPVQAWSGQIQSAVSFDLTACESGVGFLVESLTLSVPTWASQSPFTSARAHREELLKLPYMATWHGVAHDHGSGQVVLGPDGQALVRWELDDELDQRVAARAHVELACMHKAAGAREVFSFHWSERRWRDGEDFDAYLEALRCAPADDYTAYSAHQMSSCRMGADPELSVADGHGELHDTAGVWIGDASALPTAPGVNPMITIMALAERTATRILRQEKR